MIPPVRIWVCLRHGLACVHAGVFAHVPAHDQNFQFLRFGQFLSNYRGKRLPTWHTLKSGEDKQKPVYRI